MTIGMTVLIILVVLLAAFVAVFLYRLAVLRRGGTAAILRVTPAPPGDTGWRHGVIRYGEGSLVFFKLSSLRPGPDSRIDRQGIEVAGRRSPEAPNSTSCPRKSSSCRSRTAVARTRSHWTGER